MADVEKVILNLVTLEEVARSSRELNLPMEADWVIEKIDNAIHTIRELQSNQCHLNSPCEYQNKDIEIEEACEWKIVDRPNGFPIYNTSCGAIRLNHLTGVDVFCNGCGRKIKIKVVE